VTDFTQQHEAAFQEALYQDMGRLKLESQLFDMALSQERNAIFLFLSNSSSGN